MIPSRTSTQYRSAIPISNSDLPITIVDLRTIISTEDRLLEPICEFSTHAGFRRYHSEQFRNYYGGNGIAIDEPGDSTIDDWEARFLEFFPRDRFVHYTFTFPHEPAYEGLMRQARERDYHVDTYSFLFVDNADLCGDLPTGYHIRTVTDEADWNRLGEYGRAETMGEDWSDPDATEDRLFEKTRFTSEAIGIEWFVVSEDGSSEICSSLGLFTHNGIARLQDVRTAKRHQRRGLATGLLSYAIRRAIETLGVAGVAVCADTDYYAIDLYRKLGFIDQGEAVCMMRYPKFNT